MANPVMPVGSHRLATAIALFMVILAAGGCSDEKVTGTGSSSKTTAAEQATSSMSAEPPPQLTTGPGASASSSTAAPSSGSVTVPVPETGVPPRPDHRPRFEPTKCGFAVTLDLPHHCGYLIVPEDRRDPAASEVRLPVIVFEARAHDPLPDPVIYLAGGGGVDQMGMMGWYRDVVVEVTATRDFIMYNQRGAPLTEPPLDCRGHDSLLQELAAERLSREQAIASQVAFWQDCQAALTARGIDLQMYSSALNAADADDLRAALGYEQANYYGTSYGTRIGLALLRDRPEGVRSIILDSVYPPQADWYGSWALNVNDALSRVFERCLADPSCSTRYPDLAGTFFASVDHLNAHPGIVSYPGGEVVLDGERFIDLIYGMLQATWGWREAPRYIHAVAGGQIDILSSAFPQRFQYPGNWAVYFSFQCQEQAPFVSMEEVRARAASLPDTIVDYAVSNNVALEYAVCDVWPVKPAGPRETEPVVSDVPVLVLAGELDPVTPASWSRETAANLESSFYFEFADLSHGVMRSDACGRDIGLQFIDDPYSLPDSSCLAMR